MLNHRERDAGRGLCRALCRSAAGHGCAIRIEHAREAPWASATFVGAVHDLVLTIQADATLDGWLHALEEAELAVPGQIVADVVVAARDDRDGIATLRIEAHTIVG